MMFRAEQLVHVTGRGEKKYASTNIYIEAPNLELAEHYFTIEHPHKSLDRYRLCKILEASA